MKDYLGDYMACARMENGGLKAQGRAQFVADMRELAIREGLGRIDLATGKVDPVIRESDLTDIRSTRRLQLIFDTQVEAAQEYGFWKQGQDPAILYVFPAYRFLRIRPVMIPRFYHQAEEGTIRRKDDLKFWLSMNRDFNVPWGPWGYGSGMGVEDVNREDAIAAGVMSEADEVLPIEKTFNDGLSASVRDLDGGIAAALARITGGTLADGRLVAAVGSQTVVEALEIAGISKAGDMTEAAARRLIEELKEFAPVLGTSKLLGIKGAKKEGVLTRSFIEQTLNDFTEFLPPRLAAVLPDFRVEVKPSISGAAGSYGQDSQTLKLSVRALRTPESARKVIIHELLHWVHDHGGAAVSQIVQGLWDARTGGEPTERLQPWNSQKITGRRDKWADAEGDEYAGRIYDWEDARYGAPKGHEVLTRHLEKLSDPSSLVKHWNHVSRDGKHWWRDAFTQLLEIFYL
jgi:hypothetical protein